MTWAVFLVACTPKHAERAAAPVIEIVGERCPSPLKGGVVRAGLLRPITTPGDLHSAGCTDPRMHPEISGGDLVMEFRAEVELDAWSEVIVGECTFGFAEGSIRQPFEVRIDCGR